MGILQCILEANGFQISFKVICGEVLHIEIKRNTHCSENRSMRKQKCLSVLLLFLLYVPKAYAQYVTKIEQIRHFYDCYMECFETGDRKMESDLLGKFLTPEMQKKRARLLNATDSDPLLRAQDVPEHARQTLTCRHLERGWYEVTYHTYGWNEQDTVTIHIPVRTVEDEKGTLRINYITPYWGGSRYGDCLFDIPAQKVDDQSDAFIFVESFFKAYVYPYVILSPTLEQDSEQLRKQNCTSSLQEKYSVLKQSYLEDGEYMDPLIGCADFDVFWYRSIRVESIDSQTFRIRYDLGVKDWCNKIKMTVAQAKGRWFLSDIEVE